MGEANCTNYTNKRKSLKSLESLDEHENLCESVKSVRDLKTKNYIMRSEKNGLDFNPIGI